SSGGFGALHLVMRRPGLFQAAGSISGDCHFEYGYAHDFLPAVRGLELSGLTPRAYLDAFLKKPDLSGDGHAVINLMAMSACYSPNPDSELGFDLPVDLRTGERLQAVWSRWLTFDPVVIAEVYGDALRKLKWLYISAGKSDEFQLQFSARILARRLDKLGVPHEHEEFEGGHFGLDDRYLDLIPRLVGALDS
ncbi:MAG: S-formylglutathione hydrolase FrmB, partial [Planctomycetota bacterium]